MQFPQILSKMEEGNIQIIDVREFEECLEGHIRDAILMPLSNLEDRIGELDKEQEIHLICRTGRRIQMAAQIFHNHGFKDIVKVHSGMSTWKGKIEKQK